MSAGENTTLKNIIAIIGFVILLGVGVWSAFQVVQFVPRLFSDTGTVETVDDNNEQVLGGGTIVAQLSADSVASGKPVTVVWGYDGDATGGLFSFSYACVEGFYFQVAGRPVPCNAPYSIEGTATSLEVTPLSAKAQVDAPLAITFTNAQGESVRDVQTLTVTNDDTVAQTSGSGTSSGGPIEPTEQPKTSKPTPVTIQTHTPVASNPNGIPDLKVEMVAIGDINPYDVFETKSIVHHYARGAAKFKVTNAGDKVTEPWFFSAVLPTRGGYPYTSEAQPPLMPGASTEVLVTFDQLVPGVHTFTVHIDPLNYIHERNEYNNSTGQALTVLNY